MTRSPAWTGYVYLAGLLREGEVGFVGTLHFRAVGIGQ